MSGHQKRLFKVQMWMTVVMVLLNILLIPRVGIIGAAVAAALTNLGTNLWNLREVKSCLALSPYNRSYLYLAPPALVMVLAAVGLQHFGTAFRSNWSLLAVAGMSAYAIFFGVLSRFSIEADDRLVLSAVWSRLRGGFQKVRIAG